MKIMVAVFTEVSLLCFVALANLRTGRMSQRKHAMIGWLDESEDEGGMDGGRDDAHKPRDAHHGQAVLPAREGGEVQGPADGGIISIGHGHEQAAL